MNERELKPCPNGCKVDENECPYPVNREKTLWQVVCHCGWSAIGRSPKEAVSVWNTRTPSDEAREAVAEATCGECGTKVPMPLETTRTWMLRAGYLAPEWVDEVAKEIARQWIMIGQNHAEPFVRNLIAGELEKAKLSTPPDTEARRLLERLYENGDDLRSEQGPLEDSDYHYCVYEHHHAGPDKLIGIGHTAIDALREAYAGKGMTIAQTDHDHRTDRRGGGVDGTRSFTKRT